MNGLWRRRHGSQNERVEEDSLRRFVSFFDPSAVKRNEATWSRSVRVREIGPFTHCRRRESFGRSSVVASSFSLKTVRGHSALRREKLPHY